MPHFSLRDILAFVGGTAGFFAILAFAARAQGSLAQFIADSVGVIYGSLMFLTGYVAFLVACKAVRHTSGSGPIAACLPLSLLPALIGLFGLLHAYIFVNYLFGSLPSYPKPTDLLYAHSSALVCALAGLTASAPSFLVLIATLVSRAFRTSQ